MVTGVGDDTGDDADNADGDGDDGATFSRSRLLYGGGRCLPRKGGLEWEGPSEVVAGGGIPPPQLQPLRQSLPNRLLLEATGRLSHKWPFGPGTLRELQKNICRQRPWPLNAAPSNNVRILRARFAVLDLCASSC